MTDISIDDMIDARQQAQPGFKKAADKYFDEVRLADGTKVNKKFEVPKWEGRPRPKYRLADGTIWHKYAKNVKKADDEGPENAAEKEITEDEVKEADTPKGKEDVRVGTEEAAAREDKAKAIEELGKAKEDEEKARPLHENVTVETENWGGPDYEAEWERHLEDIDALIAGRQQTGDLPPMYLDIIDEGAESLTVRNPETGELIVIPKG